MTRKVCWKIYENKYGAKICRNPANIYFRSTDLVTITTRKSDKTQFSFSDIIDCLFFAILSIWKVEEMK